MRSNRFGGRLEPVARAVGRRVPWQNLERSETSAEVEKLDLWRIIMRGRTDRDDPEAGAISHSVQHLKHNLRELRIQPLVTTGRTCKVPRVNGNVEDPHREKVMARDPSTGMIHSGGQRAGCSESDALRRRHLVVIVERASGQHRFAHHCVDRRIRARAVEHQSREAVPADNVRNEVSNVPAVARRRGGPRLADPDEAVAELPDGDI